MRRGQCALRFRWSGLATEGAAVYPGQSGADGMLGDHALVTPPLVITSEEVVELVGCIDRALTRLEMDLDLNPA